MKLMKSPAVAAFVGGILYLVVTGLMVVTHAAHRGKNGANAAVPTTAEEPLWHAGNEEIDQIVSELKKEKEDIARREKALKEMEDRMQAERAEVNEVTQRVQRLQSEFDKNVIQVKTEEAANLKKLAKMYSSMAPEAASTIFKELEDTVSAKILALMKEEEAAGILELLARKGETEAKRAAEISEHLRKFVQQKVARK